MLKLVLLGLLLFQRALFFSAGSLSPWTFSTSVTVDHTQVTANQTDFPVLFRSPVGTVTTVGTAVTLSTGDQFPTWMAGRNVMINGVVYAVSLRVSGTVLTLGSSAGTQASPVAYCGTPEFATVANGGKATNANGFDVVPFTDSAGVTKYDFERERYNATTGEIVDWFRQGSLSSTVDTSVYYLMGNTAVTTDQSSHAAVWNSAFLMVQHLPNGTTLTATDSTSNAVNGTLTNTPTATSGQIDGAASLVAASNQYITMGTTATLNPAAVTVCAWVNPTTLSARRPIYTRDTTGLAYVQIYINTDGTLAIYLFASGNVSYDGTGSHTLTTGTKAHVCFSYSSAAGLVGYVNGASDHTAAANGVLATGTDEAAIGINVRTSDKFDGMIDEVKVSNMARSATWIAVEYSNQNTPFTFYSMAANVAH